MRDLIAVAYDDGATAEKLRGELAQLTREHVIEIEDAVVVTRDAEGKASVGQRALRDRLGRPDVSVGAVGA
jgi:uncharacterized membrane protein